MRLINESKAVSKIKDLKKDGAGAYAKGYNQALRTVISCLKNPDAISTAYDADKVMEQIKEIGVKICCSVKCTENCNDCEHGCLMKAILEIVKAGGVNE